MKRQITLYYDILLQTRHGFYSVYFVVCGLYLVMLYFLPSDIRNVVLPLLIYTDPCFLGFFIVGSFLMLE